MIQRYIDGYIDMDLFLIHPNFQTSSIFQTLLKFFKLFQTLTLLPEI